MPRTGNAPGWATVEIELPHTKFSGRQNNGANLRIACVDGDDICIANVLLIRP